MEQYLETRKKVCGKKKHNYKLYIVLIYSNSTWKNAHVFALLEHKGMDIAFWAGA